MLGTPIEDHRPQHVVYLGEGEDKPVIGVRRSLFDNG
jgi:hypothetical protein